MDITTITFSFPLEYPGINLGTMHHFFRYYEEGAKLDSLPPREFFGLYFNLGNDIDYEVKGQEQQTITRDQYNLVYLPQGICSLTLPKGSYACFCLEFTEEYLEVITTQFPMLKEYMVKASLKIPAFMSKDHLTITPDIREKINEVLNTQYTKWLREEFLKSRFIDLLFTCMEQAQRHLYGGLTKIDIAKVNQAHTLMTDDLKTFWSVALLADAVDLDKRKLIFGFRVIFNDTIYHLLTSARMRKAVSLLRDSNLTATEIAASVGFNRFTTFSDTFKRWYGYPPGALRKAELE
jgi:AraC-like DNA-binding protein